MMDEQAVAELYTKERNEILAAIRAGQVSATMSGIEYYPGEWADLSAREKAEQIRMRVPK